MGRSKSLARWKASSPHGYLFMWFGEKEVQTA